MKITARLAAFAAAVLLASAALAADWSDRLLPGGGAAAVSVYGALGVTAGGTGVTTSTGTGSVVLSTSPTLVTPTVTGTATFSGTIAPTSTVGILGTITNDNPAAGNVGEVLKATVVAGSAVSETTATPVNITSLSLTVGDWEVTGACDRTLTGTTATIYGCSLSGTTGTLSTQPAFTTGNITCSEESFVTQAATFGTTVTGRYDTRVGPIRCQVTTASTTIFLVGGDTFSAGTVGLFGTIRARRLR